MMGIGKGLFLVALGWFCLNFFLGGGGGGFKGCWMFNYVNYLFISLHVYFLKYLLSFLSCLALISSHLTS